MTDVGEKVGLLDAIRRLPERVITEHAGKLRISYAAFKKQHPSGYVYFEDHEEDGYFETLEAMAEYIRKDFEPKVDELNIPYVLYPCAPIALKAPDAGDLLTELQDDQEAPPDYPAPDAASLQELLDWWFKNNTKPWWTADFDRVIVLLPEERKLIYKIVAGRDYTRGDEPGESVFLNHLSSEDELDVAKLTNQPVYNVGLLVERKLSGDPLWNEVDSGQESTPVDAEVKVLCDELEHEGWNVSIQHVDLLKDEDDDEPDIEDGPNAEDPDDKFDEA